MRCERYGLGKVLIVDWDVHHGNGTQHTFESEESVFYFSTHQYPFYPGTGSEEERGRGKAERTICNIPLPQGAKHEDFVAAFEAHLVPRMKEWKPEFVLVSAGFDAHQADPLAMLCATEATYRRLTQIVCQIADEYAESRLVSLLEGGYHLDALHQSLAVHLEAMMGT